MTTKLNLTIEESLVKDLKRYAKKRRTSASKVVQEQLYHLLGRKENKKKSFVEKYAGMFKGELRDFDKIKDDYLKEKYGL
ncbi:MAG: DUF6364 family protein [Chitinophagaceae bacterium]|jgi:hypothetical protein|nr:DUF6364 family protein [Chitinophagaceae bacterium]